MSVASRAIPLCDLDAQFQTIEQEVRVAIDKVLREQNFILGPQVAELEQRIAEYSGIASAIGCSSGSDALLLALMALDVATGDEVITTPYTFFATAGAIARLGARAVFVDIEPQGFNIDADKIEAAVTPRTKGIIPVHLFGQMAEMDPILEIASRHGLFVIEDAAQAIGAAYRQRPAGSLGTIGTFSFFPSKNLGCMGDGGMCVTSDDELAERMRILRQHGAARKYFHTHVGGNFRLDTLQAAILLVKLRFLDQWNAARAEHAATYRRLLQDSGLGERVVFPAELPNRKHVYNQFVIRISNRDRVEAALRDAGVSTAIYYPKSLHYQKCFDEWGYGEGEFPESERAARESLALPIFPELSTAQQQVVIDALAVALS